MSEKTLAIVVGGLLPALILGLACLFQKLASQSGIGTGPLLASVGVTIAVFGLAFTVWDKDVKLPVSGVTHGALFGLCWAMGTAGIAVAMKNYHAQLSQLVPLYNMNTLVAVLLGLVVLAEWKQVSAWNVLGGAVLIVAGGILASRA